MDREWGKLSKINCIYDVGQRNELWKLKPVSLAKLPWWGCWKQSVRCFFLY